MRIVKKREQTVAPLQLVPTEPPPRRPPAWLAGVLAGLGVVALGTAVEYGLRARRGPPPVVMVAAVSRGPLAGSIRAKGLLAPAAATAVSPPGAGRVVKVMASVGDRVQAGQVLARFDSLALRTELARAESRLVAAEAAAFEAEVVGVRAVEVTPAPKTDQDADNLEVLRGVAEARAARAAAEVMAREAVYRLAQQRLRQQTVRAPAEGVVIAREVEPDQNVAAGATLFTIASDSAHLVLVTEVPEAEMAHITAGQRAQFTVPAFPGRTFEARVREAGALRGSEDARRLPVTLTVENPDRLLRPGMSAAVVIAQRSGAFVLRVPLAALDFAPPTLAALRDDPAVWLVDRAGSALSRVPVEVGLTDGAYAEVRGAGLHEGAAVAVGLARLDRKGD
jgi:HlyD family secretion protein